MARHRAQLPTRRRVIAAGLGAATILVLLVSLWQLGGSTSDQGAALDAAPSTVATTAPTTLPPPSTDPTTTTTSVPSTTRPPETTDTTDPPTTTTTLAPLVLEADGLGPVEFGATPEEAIAEVTARLGPASSDSGWVNSRGTFGTCPGNLTRVVRWESLRLFFSDGPTDFGEDVYHFFYYSQSSVETDVVIALRTAAGIGIASTVEELTDAYGNRLTIESTSPFGATFSVADGGPGLLSGTLTESVPEGQVTSLAGGFGCGA